MSRALEDGHGADLAGGAVGGDDKLYVLIAVVDDLGDAIVQEADADHALAGADVLGRAGAGLGVDLNILIEVYEVLDASVVTLELDHEVRYELRSAGGVVVGQPDEALILGLEKIVPALGRLEAEAGKLVGVDHEAEDTGVDAVPVAVRILVDILGQVGGVRRNVAVVKKTVSRGGVIGVVRAAEPNVSGGLAVLLGYLGGDFAGGKTLICSLYAVEFLELVAGGGEVVLLAGAVNNELAFSLCRGNEIAVAVGLVGGGGFRGSLGACDKRKDHDHSQKQSQQFLHFIFPPIDLFFTHFVSEHRKQLF